MPRKATTAKARAEVPTREVILDTAEQLFAARGVDGVAVRDLAREMGLTAPSLYNHFPSKQALYDAVLERGLSPILDILGHAWHPGALQPEQIGRSVDELTTHLATHPHLGRLLQRALLEESPSVRALILQWFGPLYRQGVAVIKETAGEAGWEPDELPHLAMGLFGMVFAYFTNFAALQVLSKRANEPFAPRTLATQRQFLEEAIYRLLRPTSRRDGRKRAARK